MTWSARTRTFRGLLWEDLERRTHEVAAPLGTARARSWLERHLPEQPSPHFQTAALFPAHAGASRHLGSDALDIEASEREALGARLGTPVRLIRRDDWGRAALVSAAFDQRPESEHAALLEALYRRGDAGEQAAILRALTILPGCDRFVALAAEATRTSVTTVFAALALENDYPARHFPDGQFEQLVLKSIFLELPAMHIVGLGERVGPRLVRMLTDYEKERRAAGRSVPREVDSIRSLEAARRAELERGTSP